MDVLPEIARGEFRADGEGEAGETRVDRCYGTRTVVERHAVVVAVAAGAGSGDFLVH